MNESINQSMSDTWVVYSIVWEENDKVDYYFCTGLVTLHTQTTSMKGVQRTVRFVSSNVFQNKNKRENMKQSTILSDKSKVQLKTESHLLVQRVLFLIVKQRERDTNVWMCLVFVCVCVCVRVCVRLCVKKKNVRENVYIKTQSKSCPDIPHHKQIYIL